MYINLKYIKHIKVVDVVIQTYKQFNNEKRGIPLKTDTYIQSSER